MSVEGVGQSGSECKFEGTVHLALGDGRPGTYRAPLIENSDVPALLGLAPLTDLRALIDLTHDKLIMLGPGGYEAKLSPGTRVLQLQRSITGHLMLPCSEFSKLNPKESTVVFAALRSVETLGTGSSSSNQQPR